MKVVSARISIQVRGYSRFYFYGFTHACGRVRA